MIELWNSLGATLQMLLKGFTFLILCWGMNYYLSKSSQHTRKIWQVTIIGVLILSTLAFLPPLWDFKFSTSPTILTTETSTSFTTSYSEPTITYESPPLASIKLNQETKTTLTIIFAIWITGVGFLFSRWLVAWFSIKRIISHGKSASVEHLKIFAESHQQLGLREATQLIISPKCTSPFLYGNIKQTVLLPIESEGWSNETLSAVFLHELAHLKGRDTQMLTLSNLAKILHWPNPLVWLGIRAWRESAEIIADETVIQAGVPATEYAEILCYFSSVKAPRHLSVGLTMADHSTEMEQRIGRLLILNNTKPTSQTMSKIHLSLLAVFSLFIGGVACSTKAQNADQDSIEQEVITSKEKTNIEKKLNSIIIPIVDFKNISVAESLVFLRQRSRQLDNTTKKEKEKGVNFVIEGTKDIEQRKITRLMLKDVPINIALKYICQSTDLRYRIDKYAVTILPMEKTEQLKNN